MPPSAPTDPESPTNEANRPQPLQAIVSAVLVGLSALIIPNPTAQKVAAVLAPLVGYGVAKLVDLFFEGWAAEWKADATLRRARRYLREAEQKARTYEPDSAERLQAEQYVRQLRESLQRQRMRRLGIVKPDELSAPTSDDPSAPHTRVGRPRV